jgi:DNA-binding Lrp family transcriptional regulator
MDALDRQLVDVLQRGIPVCERPFADISARFALTAEELLARVSRLLDEGVLTRFGPLFDAEALGGAVTLAALSAPEAEFDRIAAVVNAHPEVAHNYRREHFFNMWFIVACERPARIVQVLAEIRRETGCEVLELPKLEEYHLGLHLQPI